MKAKEFIIELKKESKPRNFVAKNVSLAGKAGQHKDKKRAEKQGDVKHKKQAVPMEAFSQAAADKNKLKYQKSGRVGHGLDWKNYSDDYKTLVNDIVDKFDNITRLVQYLDAPESTKYKIVERFFKKYGYPFELFNDVITGIEKRASGETHRFRKEGVAEGSTTEKQILTRIRQIMYDRKLSGTESNAGELHRLKQQLKDMRSQQGVAEGNVMERDREDDEGWGSMNKSEFKRRELQHELGHEKNNLQISINGRPWKVFPGRGYADSQEERSYLRSMQAWAEKKSAATGKKWTVSLTGLDPS